MRNLLLLFEKSSVNKYHREYIKTHYFDIRNTQIFCGGGTAPSRPQHLGARPPEPLQHGLDTRLCKILDPPLRLRMPILSNVFFELGARTGQTDGQTDRQTGETRNVADHDGHIITLFVELACATLTTS